MFLYFFSSKVKLVDIVYPIKDCLGFMEDTVGFRTRLHSKGEEFLTLNFCVSFNPDQNKISPSKIIKKGSNQFCFTDSYLSHFRSLSLFLSLFIISLVKRSFSVKILHWTFELDHVIRKLIIAGRESNRKCFILFVNTVKLWLNSKIGK